ncbi:MAG TPA: globin family protein [Hyphomicrobiaceae bacterium]|nr:globin family protein [Hyphomicrobiaceae bacterium]
MTPDEIELVRTSFRSVTPIADQAADLFYGRLFDIAPEVRSLFPDDLTGQKKKLMAMLATAVTNLHQVETIMPAVRELGRRHVGYGVEETHYAPVGEALIWTLDKGLGPAFTPQVKGAWVSAYTTLATVMKEAAAAPAAPARKSYFARVFG